MRALLLVLCACGGPSATKPPEPRSPAPSKPQATAAQAEITPEAFCDRLAALQARASTDKDCQAFSSMQMTRDQCVSAMTQAKSDPEAAASTNQTGTCIVGYQTCGDVLRCLASLGPKPDDLRACNEDAPGKAVAMPKAEWDKRNGANITKFSQARSSKERPLEVCTIDAENEMLTALACEDGSQPIDGHEAAEIARVGNIGKAGRCGSIVDLYRVKCPEATYELFVDAYVCPQ